MNEHQDYQRWILEHTAPRPDCDVSVSTDVLMGDLDETSREMITLTEHLSALKDELALARDVAEEAERMTATLQSRLLERDSDVRKYVFMS